MRTSKTKKAEVKLRAVLLFGAPGSGKGTQGKILGTIPNFYHFSCGDIFRNVTPDSALGKIFLTYSSRGQLVPDEPTIELWRHNIEVAEHGGRYCAATDTLVLDGIPRNTHQAQMLESTVKVRFVFYLSCPDVGKLVERLQRRALRENRLDDANIEVIRERLETYERETRPVLEYYGPELVRTIDSTQTPINVLREILRILAHAPP
ncbi:MAG TPA: nucleoside monophosphate kinase [Candidatus Baltobacteraceae bacterium]|jgi:adenylate kinase|nr:nucleoside monophosphate kinase [Candidatus Baltobacteraceae bacterium]